MEEVIIGQAGESFDPFEEADENEHHHGDGGNDDDGPVPNVETAELGHAFRGIGGGGDQPSCEAEI